MNMTPQDDRPHLNFDLHDPTDRSGLPDLWWEDSINYVPTSLPISDQNVFTMRLLVSSALLGLAAGIFFLCFAPILSDTRLLPYVLLAAVVLGLYTLLQGSKEIWKAPFVFVGVIGTWTLCVLSNYLYGLFWLVCSICIVLAQQVMLHFAWVRSAPPVSAVKAEQIQRKAERFDFWFWIQALLVLSLIVVFGPRLTLYLESTRLSIWAPMITMLVIMVYMIVVPIVFGALRGQQSTTIDKFVATWQAMRRYLNDSRRVSDQETQRYEQSVGTLQSPSGVFKFRKLTIRVLAIGIAATLIPMCDFFPTSRIPASPFDFNVFFSTRPAYDPTIPELSREEQALLHSMRCAPNHASREELLAALERWGHDDPEQILAELLPVRPYPGNWIWHAVTGSQENSANVYSLITSFVLIFLVPGLFLYLFCFAIGANYTGQILAMTKEDFALHEGSNPTPDARANQSSATPAQRQNASKASARWDSIVERVLQKHKDYIYAGRIKHTDAPFLVHLDHFSQHAHFLGGSGRGKTALALAPLISQLIRRGDCNLLVIDLKDDPNDRSFFQNTQLEAHRKGHTFKFFSNTVNSPTHLCNPFLESGDVYLDVENRASQLAEALGLLYGKKYGESYYTEAHVRVTRMVFERLLDASGYQLKRPITFSILLETLKTATAEVRRTSSQSERKLLDDAGHLLSVIQKYSYLHTINYVPEETDADLLRGSIRFEELFDPTLEPQVYFFGLNAEIDPERSGGLTRLFLNRMMKAATASRGERRPTFVVIDEFQAAAAPQFTRLFQQARSAKIGLIVANQSMPVIREHGGEALEAEMFESVAYRQVFQVESIQELERFEKLSGKYIREQKSKSVSRSVETGFPTSVSTTTSSVEASRFDITRLRVMNANRQQSVAFATINEGLSQYNGLPVLLESDFHISREEMKKRANSHEHFSMPSETTTALKFGQELKSRQMKTELDDLPERFTKAEVDRPSDFNTDDSDYDAHHFGSEDPEE